VKKGVDVMKHDLRIVECCATCENFQPYYDCYGFCKMDGTENIEKEHFYLCNKYVKNESLIEDEMMWMRRMAL